jgi:phage protein D
MGLIPAYRVIVSGQDITPIITSRVISITVTDNAGVDSDTVQIVLDDKDNAIALPSTGVVAEVSIGYSDGGLVRMGSYTIDEVEMAGPPSTMTLRGKAADVTRPIKSAKTRTWQHPGTSPPRIKLADIVKSVANEYGLTPKISDEYANVDYDVVHQTDESDLHMLTTLAASLDAVAKPANGYLLFVRRGQSKSASGKDLPVIRLTPSDVTDWSATIAERGNYSGVVAIYRDTGQAADVEVKLGDTSGNTHRLRQRYKDRETATKAANSRLQSYRRGKSTLDINMPGRPSIMAEGKLSLSGYRDGVNGDWVIETATHTISASGYTTTIKCAVSLKR